jgi:hypothetical protein
MGAAANPFDQFDAPPPKSDAAANPFDKFDHAEYVPTYTGLARNTIAGGNEGIATVAGAPVDAATWAINKGIQGVNRVAGRPVANEIQQPFGGSESIKRGIGAIGGDNPDEVEAKTPAERIFRAGGEGAGEMVTGAGEVGLIRKGVTAVAPKVYSVMEGLFGKPSIENAAIGATSGAGGQAASEVVPDAYKPVARIGGSVVGGGSVLAGRVIYEGGKFAVNAARSAAQPFTKSGQEAMAGTQIQNAASNPYAVRTSLENGPQELVPGSKPTTFQQTGDMGLGQLERKVRTENPEDFIQRSAEQNAARGSAISRIQQTGSPADVAAHFRATRNALDATTEASVSQARQNAAQQTAVMGGAGNAEAHGELMRGAAQSARDTAKENERSLWQAVDPDNKLLMPGTPIAAAAKRVEGELSSSAKPPEGEERAILDVAQSYTDKTPFRDVMDLRSRISTAMSEERRASGFTPVYGRLVRLRGAVEDSIDRAVENQAKVDKQAVAQGSVSEGDTMSSRLVAVGQNQPASNGDPSLLQFIASKGGLGPDAELEAIGAHGQTVNVDGMGRRKLVRQGGWPLDYAREAAEEAGYLRGDHNGTSSVNDLLDAIDAEMRGQKRYPEGHEGQETAREAVLRNEREQHEHYQFVRGYEDDLRDAGHGQLGEGIRQRAVHLMATNGMDADMAVETALRQMDHEEGHAAIYPTSASENGRASGQGGGNVGRPEKGNAAGPRARAPAVGMEEGTPLDEAAIQRLKAASTATRERAQTFDSGATGNVLKPGARQGEYRTPDSLVPSKIFHPGANGGESVRSYINAVGEAQAVPAIADYAAFSLRRAAARPDGTIDTAKALAWAKQHDAALSELPASVRSRLANPGRADEAVTAAVAARKQRMDAFDHSEIAKVLGTESGDVVRQIGSVFGSRDSSARMQALASATRGNPAATAGLRRAVVEHIQNQFLSNTEAGTTGTSQIKADAFQTFMRTKADVLAHVFEPQEIGALRAVANDLQRANRTINATKLAGGSNTAQDTAHRAAMNGTILNRIAIEAAAATAGHAATQSVGGGVLGWLGARTVSALRDAGISHVDDLVKEAMLNPELARSLLQKVPRPSDKGAIERIVRAAKQIAVSGPAIGATQ